MKIVHVYEASRRPDLTSFLFFLVFLPVVFFVFYLLFFFSFALPKLGYLL